MGILFVVLLYNFLHEGLAILIAIIGILLLGVGFVIQRAFNKTDSFVEQYGEADILNRMWFPLQDELTDVVKTGGHVTEAFSAWNTAPGLSKRETPRTFFTDMQRYVRQREFVATLSASDLATEESLQQLAAEQRNLLSRAQDLLEEVNRAIRAIPGSENVVRRNISPGSSPTRATATRRSPRSRRPASASRRSRAQTSTSSQAGRHHPAPSRPSPTPPRITDTSTPREPTVAPPAPPPPRITYTPTPSSPVVPPPAPREPEPPPPPSVPPAPSPVTASVPEPAEPVKPPSVPTGDLRLDIASVCEDLFDPNRMSYETNRLFVDRYKDAMVRWKGTVRRASVYSYDFDFGDGGGTKAELDIYEAKQQYGSRTVKAFVQLPVEAADDLGARMGEDVQFEGRLLTCEGSARRLYIADAHMVD